MGMVRTIVPVVAGTVMAGVKTKTGETDDPTPLEPRVIEVKAAQAIMAGAFLVSEVVTSADDAIEKVPAGAAAPRVKPDSVMVTAEVPVGLTPMLMTRAVEDPEPEVPVIPTTLDAPAANEGKPEK